MSQLYIHENLVRTQPLVHKILIIVQTRKCHRHQLSNRCQQDPHQNQYVLLPVAPDTDNSYFSTKTYVVSTHYKRLACNEYPQCFHGETSKFHGEFMSPALFLFEVLKMVKLTRGPLVLYQLPKNRSRKPVIKNNFKILKKPHAYLQTILKTPVKFQRIGLKLW